MGPEAAPVRRGRFLAALAVLVGLTVYIYFVELRGGEKKQLAEEQSKKVFTFEVDAVTGLKLTRGAETLRLEKEAEGWKIAVPVSTASEAEAVERLLGSLHSIRTTHDLGKPADLSPFDLAAPPLVVEVSLKDGKSPPPLAVGDDAPTGGGAYARPGPDGKVLIISGAEGARGATLFSLRDKTFFKFDPARLEGLTLMRGSKDELSLARLDGKWGILSPSRTAAEDTTVADLNSALERLTVTEFVEEKPSEASLAAHGLVPGELRVRLHSTEWKSDPELRFGRAEGGGLFAVHPGSGALVKVSDSIVPKLKSSLADLRRKDLMPVQSWDLAGLRITGLTSQPLELRRKGDKEWNRVSPSAAVLPDEDVDLLLRNLTDLKAEEFRDGVTARGALGLDPPKVRLEFWKQGEEGRPPAVLRVGRVEAGKRVFFQDEKWPSVALADAAVWQRAVEQAGKIATETPKPPPEPQTAPAAGKSGR
jgi:hypothetical protein